MFDDFPRIDSSGIDGAAKQFVKGQYAMPIVEKPCAAYEGFVYKRMDDPYADMRWDREIAEHNFKLCFDRITIPHDAMNDELESLLKMQKQDLGVRR